ncbi:MAG: 3-deoxy-manno-octulosonate cytidylyltransferase, partial [Alphaproteobacteria bacterium]|nr:3-deoxy-manno-octulosonate cytidylyltransferase [Alphaproteobacteria bacterium]
MTKIIGIVPARMAASRFPGKPLFPILGRPMVAHCFARARLY